MECYFAKRFFGVLKKIKALGEAGLIVSFREELHGSHHEVSVEVRDQKSKVVQKS